LQGNKNKTFELRKSWPISSRIFRKTVLAFLSSGDD